MNLLNIIYIYILRGLRFFKDKLVLLLNKRLIPQEKRKAIIILLNYIISILFYKKNILFFKFLTLINPIKFKILEVKELKNQKVF